MLGSEIIYTVKNDFGEFQVKSFDKNQLNYKEVYLKIAKNHIKFFDKDGDLIEQRNDFKLLNLEREISKDA